MTTRLCDTVEGLIQVIDIFILKDSDKPLPLLTNFKLLQA